ncbi:heat shock 70 kDa protein 12A-like [Crassostrea angulata]|uniref:heat shock 70 kDa protein 12A-like n=1 Tax=Magallana angulata TaxID=2784310 RepID=UPI0022B0FE2D|nr:heat shock 70 kDa protein 12A-like [Crassostrea angulata]
MNKGLVQNIVSGGTVDFSIQETTDTGKMKSIYEVCGGPWGGTIVDQQFIQFLIKLVGADVFTEFKDKSRSEYLELMRILEIKKKQVDYNSQTMIPIGVPIALFEILEEHTGCNISEIISMSPYSNSVTYLRDKLRFDASLLRSFFRSSLHNIISHLRDILEEPACQDLLGIVVVGGYADSQLVIESLKDAFPGRRIIEPMESGLAVAKGAVLFGHDPYVICSRVCRYTYGDDICLPFDKNKHPYGNMTQINKVWYCKNIFRKFF